MYSLSHYLTPYFTSVRLDLHLSAPTPLLWDHSLCDLLCKHCFWIVFAEEYLELTQQPYDVKIPQVIQQILKLHY